MTTPRLLLVEDEFLIRMTLSEVLAEDGFEVVEAEDAEAALERLGEKPDFAMMLTDIQLPGRIDGRTLAHRARQACPDLPVIFMSGPSASRALGEPARHLCAQAVFALRPLGHGPAHP